MGSTKVHLSSKDYVLHPLLQINAQAHPFLQDSSMGNLHLFTHEPMGQHTSLEVPEETLKTLPSFEEMSHLASYSGVGLAQLLSLFCIK